MNNKVFSLLLLLTTAISTTAIAQNNYTQYVDPFIGSGGHGHVFVGANVPFGSVQLGPQNFHKGWDWCSGYHYSDSIVVGFNHTHLSGTGCSDLGDIALMPYIGKETAYRGTQDDISGSTSAYYKHSDETCQPGYYAVKLSSGIDVELTATAHVGLHHYTFPAQGDRHVMIDVENANTTIPLESYIKRIDDYTIEGYRFCDGWSENRKIFFVAKFNQPITSLNIYVNDELNTTDELQSKKSKGICSFSNDITDLYAKVAISSVSISNAKENMAKELPDFDFNRVKQQADENWNELLGRIEIEATKQQKTIFYTALYHTFIAPTLYQDVNGQYRGMDDKIYSDNNHLNYTAFSLWDTYRQLHPMYTIVLSDRVDDMITSMLSIYEQNGKLPIWPLWNNETNCMPGYSSVPIIADAYLKGFRGFDAEKALRYMISTATNPQQKGVSLFMKYGYIPADSLSEATSIQLEYAVDDMGIALMAKALGQEDTYQTFLRRALSYQQLFDNKIQKIHPKMADGSWYEPYDPFLADHHGYVGDFTEGNGWQYTFMTPQDPDGLVTIHGGDEAFIKNLDEMLVAEGYMGEDTPDVTGMIGQYSQGNEPSHHVPYLYAYAGAQWKTAELVRRLQKTFYTDQPDGYCGNEDCGQMSAWHVMSAIGFYQVTPSDGQYVLGSPLFRKATIHLQNGKDFIIETKGNNDKNIYINNVELNGQAYNKSYITYDDIMRGGYMKVDMKSRPNKRFGAEKSHRPHAAK